MISTFKGASLIPKSPKGSLAVEMPILQEYEWPVVSLRSSFDENLQEFLEKDKEQQHKYLAVQKQNHEEHGKFINECLSQIYAYIYGYPNNPCYMTTNDELEIKIQRSKILLERELIQWLNIPAIPKGLNQSSAAQYLVELINENTGVFHSLYDFVATKASKRALLTFLFTETVRTEVVDDEVSFMIVGLQGPLKRAASANLWDECGRGSFSEFHTYWLRMLLEQLGAWDQFKAYREEEMPWFAMIVSNAFNLLLTRPGFKYAAYGHFVVGESWVPPHFIKTIEGMKRVGYNHPNELIYFDKHVTIDPHHTQDLIDGIAHQRPVLSSNAIDQILLGAHEMVAAGTAQYQRMLTYLSSL